MAKLPVNILMRIMTSLVLIPTTLWFLSFGGMVASVFLGIAFLICLCELYALLLPLKPHETMSYFLVWFVYICMAFIGVLCVLEYLGAPYLIFLSCLIWSSDVGGYIVGNLIKGPKLAPTISPSKTWAGAVGSVIFVISVNSLFAKSGYVGPYRTGVHIILSGVFISILVQLGDLVESYFKRQIDVKDISRLLPGHGGLVDRLDGYIMVFFTIGVLSVFMSTKALFCNMGMIPFCD